MEGLHAPSQATEGMERLGYQEESSRQILFIEMRQWRGINWKMSYVPVVKAEEGVRPTETG